MLLEIAFLITQCILLVVVLVFIGWRLARDISGYYDSPFIMTPRSMLPRIEQALSIRPGDVVYDLGCGDGRMLFYSARLHPDARFIGIERNPLLIAFLRIRQKLSGLTNISFRKENVFDASFSDATRIYAFLLTPVMHRLYESHAFPPGVRLASRAFQIAERTPETVITLSNHPDQWNTHLLYIYGL